MSKIWYKDMGVLLKNVEQIFPSCKLNNIEKKNALARFAILYIIIILLINGNRKWIYFSLLILAYTYLSNTVEKFSKKNKSCVKPTRDNPMMNFTLEDYYKNVKRDPACNVSDVQELITKEFERDIVPDSYDIYNRNLNQRQFYTMPVTQVVNNQKVFAEWLYGDIGKCKAFGVDCAKHSDNKYHPTRSVYSY